MQRTVEIIFPAKIIKFVLLRKLSNTTIFYLKAVISRKLIEIFVQSLLNG